MSFDLVPLTVAQLGDLRRDEAAQAASGAFPFGNRSLLSSAHYERARSADVLVDAAIVDRFGSLVGAVTAYRADLRCGTCWLAVSVLRHHQGTGAALFPVARFIDRLFAEWPIRQLYLRSHTPFGTTGPVRRVCEPLGTLPGRCGAGDGEHYYRIEAARWREMLGPAVARRYGVTV